MSVNEVVLGGTLKPDGTLELDQKPSLSPGRVTVVLRPVSDPAPLQESWWDYMQRGRRELEASGHGFLSEQEMAARIEELRTDEGVIRP